jgi:hypothetical protein
MLLRLICAFEPRRNFIPAGVSRGPIFSIDQMFEDANVKLADRRNRHIRVGGATVSRRVAARPPEFGEVSPSSSSVRKRSPN